MKRCVMIVMAAVLSMMAFGQSRFHFGLDYQRGFGWMEKDLHDGEMATPADGYKLAGNTFKLTEWYDVNPSFTVGLGLAFDYYSSPTHGSFPVVASCMWKPFAGGADRLFGYADAGYAPQFHFKNGDICGGLLANAGIGCRVFSIKKTDINIRLGYNIRQFTGIPFLIYNDMGDGWFEYDHTEYVKALRHSLSVGVGLVF